MISFERVSKQYGAKRALDNVSFDIAPGDIFGLLGPNGAGKTTAIGLLMGHLRPTAGRVQAGDYDSATQALEARRLIGYVPDRAAFHDGVTARQILVHAGRMHGLSKAESRRRADDLLAELGLAEVADALPTTFSLGMRRKLALARARMHAPPIFVLDEPTNGLDPFAARDIEIWMRQARCAGATILLSTHALDLAERVCSKVAILNAGRLVAVAAPEALKRALAQASLLDAFLTTLASEARPT